ncbi:hypothetical protein [Ferrovibrio sp.]|uniref:hypothetical protein n=1 Tax=Ferrovibrio sp. TaxID=1917215 RepID=UPI0025BF12D7|nr:hypothetical protein [Ferrovibrio sp.]MBX3456213.1 hypothetical protein [Ferrovibrio sp.]
MPTEQPSQSPLTSPKHSGHSIRFWRRLWNFLGDDTVARAFNLLLLIVVCWLVMEAATMLIRGAYKSFFVRSGGYAVSEAIEYAMGLRVQTDKDIAALPEAPVYPLPPICLVDARYTNTTRYYAQAQACLGNFGNSDPIFGGWCDFGTGWRAHCRRRAYGMHVLQHEETFVRLVAAIKDPCRFLPSPDKIAKATDTDSERAKRLLESWSNAGCNGSQPFLLYWLQLDFIAPSQINSGKRERIHVMISNRD